MQLYDTKAVARFLDLSERRIRQLRDERVIEEYKGRIGFYDISETTRRYITYLRKGSPQSEDGINYNAERAKLVRAKRLNEEYDLKIKENKLHSSEDIETVLTNMLINFKSRLMAIPTKLSPILSKKTNKTEIYKILKDNIDEALNEFAEFNNNFSERLKNETNDK